MWTMRRIETTIQCRADWRAREESAARFLGAVKSSAAS